MCDMATVAKRFSCLLLILLHACCQSEARESKFFSRYIHAAENINKKYVTVPSTVLKKDLTPSPAPTPLTSQISSPPASAPAPAPAPVGYAPARKATLVDDEELSSENPEAFSRNGEPKGYWNNYGKGTAFWTPNYKGYRSEPQGMSDTRLLDNGEYYHDPQHENYSPVNNGKDHYYANKQRSRYEFDSMEEYEKQEGYPDVQQYQFIP